MGWFLYDNGLRHERVKRWSRIKSIQQISDFLIEMSLGNRSSTREFLNNIRNSQKKNSRKKNSNCYWLSILTNYFVKRTFNPIQNGERAKRPPTNFCPVTSTNVRISDWNFLTFSFNPFETLVQNLKAIPSPSPKLLNLNQTHSSKKLVFLVKSL